MKKNSEAEQNPTDWKLVVAVIVVVIVMYLWTFGRQTINGLIGKTESLDSRAKKINQLISKKEKLKKDIEFYIKVASFSIRFILIGVLGLCNYFIGHKLLGYKYSDISEFLTLNAGFAFILAVASFLFFGSKERLEKYLENTNGIIRRFLFKRLYSKYDNLEEQIETHRSEREKIQEERKDVQKELNEMNSIFDVSNSKGND